MTPERAAALKLMEQAIEAMRASAVEEREAEVLTAWITVCSYTSYDEGGGKSAMSVYMPDTMPFWQQMGMLKAGELMVDAGFLEVPTDQS